MSTATIGLAAGGLVMVMVVIAWLRTEMSAWRIVVMSCFGLTSLALFVGAGYSWWFHHRQPPPAVVQELFAHAVHERVVRSSPRPLVINIVRVDLMEPQISLLVTPATPTKSRQQRARTTSEFAIEYHAQIAINANFFKPWSPGYWDYEPKLGEPVDVIGPAVSGGNSYGDPIADFTSLCFTKDKDVHLGVPNQTTDMAVSGRPVLVLDGIVQASSWHDLAPRTAVGVTEDSKQLIIVTVDGRQPNYSEGMTINELADFMREQGAYTALNLDGGGSTTLVVHEQGKTRLLNSPIHRRVPPGQERPVANHFGVLIK